LIGSNTIRKFQDTAIFVTNLDRDRRISNPKPTGLDPQIAMLRSWQANRLTRTHADLLSNPKFRPACQFFLSDIYAARDFSRRDNDLEYMYSLVSKFLPDFMISLVRKTVEINDLSNNLDKYLLERLVNDLGVTNSITPEQYAQAYRLCDNYTDRIHQIEMIVEIGKQVEFSTRLPLVGTTIKIARSPAKRAGWSEVHEFLENGFKAFKHMRGAKKFLNTLFQRELTILNNIYQQNPNPFEI